MKLRWTRPALADLIEAQEQISKENPQAAGEVAQRVWDSAANLVSNPKIGRAGHVAGTREWVVRRAPYLIVYRERPGELEILRVWHTRRDWQNEPLE